MPRKQFDNNYVVNYTDNGDSTFTVDSVQFYDTEEKIDKPYLGTDIVKSEGNITLNELFEFLRTVEVHATYHNNPFDVLRELLTNYSEVKIIFGCDHAGEIYVDNSGEDFKLIWTTIVDDGGNKTYTVFADLSLFGGSTIEQEVSESEYWYLISQVVVKWSSAKLMPRVRT